MLGFHILLTTYVGTGSSKGVQWVAYIEIHQRLASKSAKNTQFLALFCPEFIRRAGSCAYMYVCFTDVFYSAHVSNFANGSILQEIFNKYRNIYTVKFTAFI